MLGSLLCCVAWQLGPSCRMGCVPVVCGVMLLVVAVEVAAAGHSTALR
jgi:hypothetical protein